MKIITVYAYHGDGGERSKGPILGYCSTESKAVEAAKGVGFWGSNGAVEPVSAIQIDDKIWVLVGAEPIDLDGKQAEKDKRLREKTMARLTDEEKRVLGL